MTRDKRAQTSVEFLVLLAIAVFILITAVVLSSEQLGDINKLREQNDAKNAILDISAAAKEVYAQGEGAKKQVYVMLPSSYEANASIVENNTIRLKARDTDFAAVENFDVHGSLPGTSGGHWVWVISEGNRVRIGTAMISVSKNSVFLIMDRNSTESTSLSVKNIWGSDITVSHTETWTPTEVSMGVLPSGSFSLGIDESQNIDFTFSALNEAVGYYNGEIRLTADDGLGNTESLRVPITVEVIGFEQGAPPPLNVTPDIWVETMLPGENASETFTVCTNLYTAPSSVTFTPSAGPPGSWVGNTTPLGPMAADSCEQKILNLAIPNGTSPFTYEGSIHVVGEGVSGAEDTITLVVIVQDSGSGLSLENQSMCNCPVGSTYWGVPVCQCVPATVYVKDGIVVGGPDNGLPYNGTLRGGSGTDVIVGTNGSDIILTDVGGDLVCGEDGDDIIYGDNTGDMLDGGPGNDIIYGEGADDWLYGKAGDDTIYGGQGNDDVDAGSGNDVVYGEHGDDEIYGGPGNDIIYGGVMQDLICGNAGSDTLYAEGGNDELDGGTGIDTLDGDIGNDDCYAGETVIGCERELPGYHTECGPS